MAMMWKVNQYFVTYWNFADTTLKLFHVKIFTEETKKEKSKQEKTNTETKKTHFIHICLEESHLKKNFYKKRARNQISFHFSMCPIPICIWLFFFLFKLKSERKSTWKVFLLLSHTLVWYSWRDILSKHVMFLLWSYIDVRDEIRVMHKEHRLVQGRKKKKKEQLF